MLAAALCVLLVGAASAAAQDSTPQHFKPPGGSHRCRTGTKERPVHRLTLDNGRTFCLQLPRLLKNPEKAVAGTASFARTYNDTCGMFAITLHKSIPAGAGPVPHLHLADTEFFMPTTPGDTVRMFAQADDTPLKTYPAGQMPAFNVPPVAKVGHLDVPYGRIAYSPPGIPHSWKAATNMTNFMALWLNGFVMIPSVNVPAMGSDYLQVLYETSAWGSPTDITSAMFNGPQFVTDALSRRAGLPPTPFDELVRLQKAIDAGDKCCGDLCA